MYDSVPIPLSSTSINCDVVIVGLQEIAEFSKINIFTSKEQKYQELQKVWQNLIHEQIGGEQEYFFVGSHHMAGVTTYIFAKKWLQLRISDIEIDDVPQNIGGKILNKGGVGMRFWIDDTSIAVINCHLPAGQSNIEERISTLNYIHERVFQKEGLASYKRDPIWKSDKVILMGNLNFRVDKKFSDCQKDISFVINEGKDIQKEKYKKEIQSRLIAFDQLKCLQALVSQPESALLQSENNLSMEQDNYFKNNSNLVPQSAEAKKYYQQHQNESLLTLQNYFEKQINFLPTYKFDVGTNNYYDSSWNPRVPSYSDRILIWDIEKQNQNIEDSFLYYDSITEMFDSDHKPIYALLRFEIKEVNWTLRTQIADQIQLKYSVSNLNQSIEQNQDQSVDEKDNQSFSEVHFTESLTDDTFF